MPVATRKITPRQRHQLIQVHLHLGYEASRPLCLEYGVARNYAAKMASEIGLLPPLYTKRRGAKRSVKFEVVDHNDHRWAWAVERGSVVA